MSEPKEMILWQKVSDSRTVHWDDKLSINKTGAENSAPVLFHIFGESSPVSFLDPALVRKSV